MKIKELFSKVRELAPEEYAAGWDNSGMQVAGEREKAEKLAVTLDPTPAVLEQAVGWGADAVVSHHPLYMKPRALGSNDDHMACLRTLIGAGVWLYSAHTSLDARPKGPARWLGDELGLTHRRILEPDVRFAALEVFFMPETPISREVAEVWTGREGVRAVTQAASGEVRLVCDADVWADVRQAVRFTAGDVEFFVRRLEEPAFVTGYGELGRLPGGPVGWGDFVRLLNNALFGQGERRVWTLCGAAPESVETVAYCPGSGGSLAGAARAAGADVLVTGDMKYHLALEAGLAVADVGHFVLEEEMMRRFAAELDETLKGVEVRFFPGVEPMTFVVEE